jgi:ribonuclease Z
MDDGPTTMLSNSPYHSLALNGLTIEGYSRAMVQSVWRVPEFDIGFDAGAMPWQFLNTAHWFISHTHLDHLAALPVLVSRREIMGFPVGTTIYLPESMVDPVWEMLQLWEKLDRGPMGCSLKGLQAGDEVEIGREHLVKAYAMVHPVPALGYILWERRHKLKPEYAGLPGDHIRDLKKQGVEVTFEHRSPLFAYTGDTSPQGLDENPDFLRAKFLVTEMTFTRPNHPRENVHAYGHMHLEDFVERADRFENERVIVGHVSSRYELSEAQEAAAQRLPERLRERVMIWPSE